MFFLNRKERKLAKHNKKLDDAQYAYDNRNCYTCKYSWDDEIECGCKLNLKVRPRDKKDCEGHVYSRRYKKAIDYIENDAYKEFFNREEK